MSFFYKIYVLYYIYIYIYIYIYLFKLRSALNSCKFSINALFKFKCWAYSREHLLNINSQAFKITVELSSTSLSFRSCFVRHFVVSLVVLVQRPYFVWLCCRRLSLGLGCRSRVRASPTVRVGEFEWVRVGPSRRALSAVELRQSQKSSWEVESRVELSDDQWRRATRQSVCGIS